MLENIAPEGMSVVAARSFADPEQFGAVVARIDSDIEALALERRKLAEARRKVAIICAAYVIIALCAQDALRRDLSQAEVAHVSTVARRPATSAASALPMASMRMPPTVAVAANPL